MSESTIRAAIYALVNAVTDAGQVYDYDRWTSDWAGFIDLFKGSISGRAQIRGWEVGYEGFTVERMQFRDSTDKGGELRAHRFIINGYMGQDDGNASEKTFSALAESVCNALDNAETIRAPTFYYAPEASLSVDRLMFGSVLCHHALIVQEVQEYQSS